ncbi:acyl carrier protein [Streptomyces sp. CHD11]|uniref:acyl carrier protein n=1 Tax=Streptomyces sp. CHD11 TaxID=2741325 RepID=UPI001BFC331D|nr:acyl carrier protein [Streptomyces sp. CHD11]MBT3152544.1 acyl carrier protein [Streptomyces sp. CHD11]
MITTEVTFEELSALMKQAAGISVDPLELKEAAESPFDSFGLDSLGLLGIVGELENRYGQSLPPDTERCRTPREFLNLINGTLTAGA